MASTKRIIKYSLRFLAALLLVIGVYTYYVNAVGNFRAITPGEAYRSAQLDKGQLFTFIKLYHIKSVINLRGANPGKRWYDDEVSICRELGVEHYDIGLSAQRELRDDQVSELISIFKKTQRPVLIHCAWGSDRTGLAAAMWKHTVDKEPKSEAAKQLTIWLGHMPLGKTQAMDRTFERWNP